ncbi:MAG: KTSC domain-containing protein [Acetobacteraceae bacterium]|nr:KTSC domain-containing protein [Acetobacteraceae bacterium]
MQLDSRVLQTAAYDGQLASLQIQFRSGAVYHYFEVPRQTYQELLQAESKGQYFNSQIRNRFRFARLEGTAQPSSAGI